MFLPGPGGRGGLPPKQIKKKPVYQLIPWFNQDEDIIIAKSFSILGQVASQIEQEPFKLEEA